MTYSRWLVTLLMLVALLWLATVGWAAIRPEVCIAGQTLTETEHTVYPVVCT